MNDDKGVVAFLKSGVFLLLCVVCSLREKDKC